jgi:serine/threonine-protein kinase RsbW
LFNKNRIPLAHTYSLEISSNPNNLITVEEFVNYFAKETGLDEEKLQSMLLCITEATTNAIVHANKSNPDKKVSLKITDKEDKVEISIKDEGKGFNPDTVPNPTNPENLLKDSGRGIYLMRFYMDELKYNITPEGTETILILKK